MVILNQFIGLVHIDPLSYLTNPTIQSRRRSICVARKYQYQWGNHNTNLTQDTNSLAIVAYCISSQPTYDGKYT